VQQPFPRQSVSALFKTVAVSGVVEERTGSDALAFANHQKLTEKSTDFQLPAKRDVTHHRGVISIDWVVRCSEATRRVVAVLPPCPLV
jgi:hypothetical protein